MSEHEPRPDEGDARPTTPVPDATPPGPATGQSTSDEQYVTSELPPPPAPQQPPQEQNAQQGWYTDPGYQQAGGYQQGGYQQGGYQQPGYPGGGYPAQPEYPYGYPPAAPRTDDKAVWALVSSIAGFVLCPIVLHIVGWVLANQSLRTIRESGGTVGGDGVAKTARVLSIVGIVLYSLALLVGLFFLVIAIPLGLFAASTVDGSIDGSIEVSNDNVRPVSVSQIDGETFSHDVGDVTYDLSGLDFSGRTATMDVALDAGSLLVEVPDEVTVVVDAQVGAGELDVFGERRDGVGVDLDVTSDGSSSDGGTLELDLQVGLGELEVSRD